jgi:hypothetical protein
VVDGSGKDRVEDNMPDTEAIDKLFLELSQFTNATTAKELNLQAKLDRARKSVAFFASVIKSGERWSCSCEEMLRGAME